VIVSSDTPAKTGLPEAIQKALDAPDRLEADRALDAGRKTGELLAFFGIAPGMKVADLGAGGGYTTELLARIVGPQGKVYGQNNRFFLERFAEKPWSERLARPVNQKVVRVDREFDDPLPDDAQNLDAVVFILVYHDTVWLKTKRDQMNRKVFGALRSGGVYAIVDHSAKAGAGTSDTETLHRIEEKVVVAEIQAAGFRLAARSDMLRNTEDARDWNSSPRAAGERRGTSDRFVLRFEKP
jgi:predicted methyltransferase